MACSLAKIHRPEVDIRKPYTEIGSPDAYSGRGAYDEPYLTPFIQTHRLPLNDTSAWLTPVFRTNNRPLTPDITLTSSPKRMAAEAILLLDDIYRELVTPEDVLAEMIRMLLVIAEERRARMETLQAALAAVSDETTLSAADIVTLIEQHLKLPRLSRLPVLVVAAAYRAAEHLLGERVLPFQGHNVADRQAGALGDLEIVLVDDHNVVTAYEMKKRRVTVVDIDGAVKKIAMSQKSIDNYVFVTTESIDPEVNEYANTLHATIGIEFAILDCLSFLRHFLYLFYRLRLEFLEAYQALVLAEPTSAVNQPLKEAFLALRQAAESSE